MPSYAHGRAVVSLHFPVLPEVTDMVHSPRTPPQTAAPHAAGRAMRHPGMIYAGIGGSILAVLVADMATPLGVATWIFYLLPITLSLFLRNRVMPMVVAASCTLLMVIAFLTDPAEGNRLVAEANRGFGILTFWVMAVVGYFYIANETIVRRQAWIYTGKAGLAQAMSGDLKPGEFGNHVLTYLVEFLGGHVGTFFVLQEDDFQRTATYGIPSAAMGVQHATADEGLLGQAIQSGRVFHFQDVPEGYLTVGSSLGQTNPRSLVIAPMKVADKVKAVVEIGFMTPVTQDTLEFLETVCEPVGVAVASSRYRVHLQRLLAETRQQAEELQQQGEELRVSNEELEVQSQVLQQSQAQLEQQQVELEQSNLQLEEKTQLLRAQRDELAKATLATQAKAQELETTSRYKSDFLANMSHELRTPLNSSLILAKLLAENAQGNLTPEQVVSAETIHSAGNDLLLLINDILDLSKIEAGKMTVHPEAVWLTDVVAELEKYTRPLTDQKGLELLTRIEGDLPEQIVTDQQRLEQILKNLLSNAVKFTDQGKIELLLSPEGEDRIAIRVVDTGIGISPEDQATVFEAFRQVDSAANRKYNGTGLGLSITTELARILGGQVRLESELNRGSTFTLILPLQFDPATASESAGAASEQAGGTSTTSSAADHTTMPGLSPADLDKAMAAARGESETPQSRTAPRQRKPIVDDREKLRGDQRVILIVEDDESFASILANVAHEMDFQCVIATTAQEAMALAAQFLPQAILLDVGLPDETGLVVLDRLKQDARTRHIPVHVISANDFSETALALGAVGYAVKPVTREMLLETLQDLQTQLNQRTRRVLVVEDDEVQLASMQKLLASRDVETTGAETVAECLEHLKRTTFDCMVLDLTLPDSSGYSLLETLSQNDDYSFPPVIIYTGRELTPEQEHALRRYSKSIIIKGAKSPERLLDEVTLFLHQVVDELPEEQQQMIKQARSREAALEGRRILVVEDDVRNVFALTSILEPRGAIVQIARNGKEALAAVAASTTTPEARIDLVLMDVMMPEMDGLTATREIRTQPQFKNLPIIMLTAKAMKNDQLECIQAGANDYMAKPLDVDRLLSLVRVWIRNR